MEGFLAYASSQQEVTINEEALASLCDEIRESYESLAPALQTLQAPLRFDSLAAELDFIGLYHLLSIGGMYEHRAKEAGQACLSDIVLFGLIGAYITSGKLDVQFMSTLALSDVAQLFSLPISERTAAPEELSSFVSIEQPGALLPYATLLHNSIIAAASSLQRAGYSSIGAYLLSMLYDASSVEASLLRIATDMPIVDDRIVITSAKSSEDHGTMTMYALHKNLHCLIYDLAKRDDSRSIFGSAAEDLASYLSHLTPGVTASAVSTLLQKQVISGENEVSSRLVATALCYRMSAALCDAGINVSAFEVSLLLDKLCDSASEVRYIPSATGSNW